MTRRERDRVTGGSVRPPRFALPFNVTLLMVVMAVLVPLCATLFGVGWYAVRTLQTANIDLKIARANDNLTLFFTERMRSLAALERRLAGESEFAAPPRSGGEAIARGHVLIGFVEQFPSLTAVYAGYSDGSLTLATMLTRLSAERRSDIDASAAATWALWFISFDTGERSESWIFLDDAGNVRGQRAIKGGDYDPRSRPWYKAALRRQRQTMTDPYQFVQGGGLGITAATPFPRDVGVLAADLSLNSLSSTLRQYKVSPSARMKVMTESGKVLADSVLGESGSRDPAPAADTEQQIDGAMTAAMQDLPGDREELRAERATIEGESYFVLARALPPAIDKKLFLAMAVPAKEFTAETDELIARSSIIALGAVCAAVLIVIIVSRLLAHTLERLTEQTQRFRRLEFSNTAPVQSSVREISRLAQAVDRMRSGLELFGHYIPKEIVRRLLDSDDAGKIGGVRRDVTVMFTDIEGFSAISETTDPELLMSRLSEYFSRVASTIIANRGTVDKYIGDGTMSVWNAPDSDPDHVANACRGALAILAASLELADQWQRRGLPPFHTRIGIHRGLGVVGNVGSSDRMNYTLIGGIVNLASRLEGINKIYGTRILASTAVYEAVRERFVFRRIDRVVPVGTSETCDIYELIAERSLEASGAVDEPATRLVAAWSEAFADYTRGNFPGAHRAFDRLCAEFPEDKPARVFAERCAVLAREGRPANWDGVTRLSEK